MTAATSRPSTAASTDRILAELVEDYLARLQAGEPIDPSAFAAAHPEHAEVLRPLLPALEMMADLGRSLPRGDAASPRPDDPGPAAGLLGDFRLIREVGRGGMGVVYEAEQVSLGRRVALKVLPFAAALDPRQLQRFKVEAQAAAQLHHTHIVPVFSVGCERGVHYYAMQFIDGRSLAEVIRALRHARDPATAGAGPEPSDPTPLGVSPGGTSSGRPYFQAVARLGVQAAESLEYAHALGIVHRDVKPANLLLDARGTLWLTDFGLARLHADAGLTMTGDVLGTLRYMSPEQALGRRVLVDQRADIYSLGVTLYELLTLRPAFDGRDRQELLRQIAFEEPPPPRRVDPALPRELETIVLKAMAKEPADRYATAHDLADDLRRFLEHRPIHARRPNLPERAAKWARRHTRVVVAALSMLVLAVVALATSTALIARKEAEAERQRDKARERLSMARRAVDDMYTQVATKWLAQQPRLEPAQREFLLKALAAYERFTREDEGDSPALRRELALALQRAGEIRLKLGEFKAAESDLRRARAAQRELVTRFLSAPEYRRDLSTTLVSLALLLQTTGRPAESIAAYYEAVALQRRLVEELPKDTALRRSLVRGNLDLGRVLAIEGRADEAILLQRQSIEISRALVRDFPDEADNRLVLSRSLDCLGTELSGQGQYARALELSRESLAILDELAREFPGEPNYRLYLAGTHGNRGVRLSRVHRRREAIDASRRAVDLLAELVRDFPSRPMYRGFLTNSLNNLAEHLRLDGNHREASEVAERARHVGEALVAEYPLVPDYREMLGWVYERLGDLSAMARRFDQADASFARALAIFDKLVADDPARGGARGQVGAMYSYRVDLLTQPGRADVEPGRAVGLAEEAVARCPKSHDAWRALGRARYYAGDWKGALVALRKARAIDDSADCNLWLLLALTHSRLGDRGQARDWYDKAVTWMEQDPEPDWSRHQLRDEAAALIGQHGRPEARNEEATPPKH